MGRERHGWRVYHPTHQVAILRRLKGEPESPAETRIVEDAIAEIEGLLKGRRRMRRLPTEKAARQAQALLFRARKRP